MFNIGENTKINGLENVLSVSHLQHQIHADSAKEVKYTYFGSIVRKGTVKFTTADGVVYVDFDVKNGWAREITIRKAVNK